jgi:hypothetical protein
MTEFITEGGETFKGHFREWVRGPLILSHVSSFSVLSASLLPPAISFSLPSLARDNIIYLVGCEDIACSFVVVLLGPFADRKSLMEDISTFGITLTKLGISVRCTLQYLDARRLLWALKKFSAAGRGE